VTAPSQTPPGTVYLVGGGPGDPGLLTLRGKECLALADVVLYDGLVNPLLLLHTSARCERTSRMEGDGGRRLDQAAINAELIAAAKQGKTVVRLKGGDPFLFGRGSEEAAALAAEGIPFEVIPGVTAAMAGGEYAGFSLTHRDMASAVAFVTGHEDPLKSAHPLDYAALAKFPGTLVFYMGLHRLPAIVEALVNEGMPATTPAAVICRASRPTQRTITATLATLAEEVAKAHLAPPSLIIVGECVTQRERIAWFEEKPLFGLRIGITRPEGHSEETINRCLSLGAEPVLMPAIDIQPLEDFTEVDATLTRLHDFDWLVFTSANGVRAFFDRLWSSGGDARRLANVQIACIGPATEQALEPYHLRADLVPETYRAEELAAALAPHVAHKKVLWARATRGRDVLPTELTKAGAEVTLLPVYQNIDRDSFSNEIIERIAEGSLDWIGLSSPSIARSLSELWPKADRHQLGSTIRLAAISPVTADAATECNLPIAATAESYTWEGIFTAIKQAALA